MTLDQVVAKAGRQIDCIIAEDMDALETRIRRDVIATGPEDADALDRPRDPDSPFQRVTVEELIERQRTQLRAWHAETLIAIRLLIDATTPDRID